MKNDRKRSRRTEVSIGGTNGPLPLFDEEHNMQLEGEESGDDSELLVTLANASKGPMRFRQKFREFSRYKDEHVLTLRNELRKVWHFGGETEEILQKWLDSEPALLVEMDPTGDGFTLNPRDWNLPGRLVFAVIRLSGKLKVCGNPECPAPYFIAVKATQRYCSSSCAAPAKKAAKLRWWKRNLSRDAIARGGAKRGARGKAKKGKGKRDQREGRKTR